MSQSHPVRPLDRGKDAPPLYRQLYRELLMLVDTLSPGDRFPSERELIDMYQVSRMTIHQALRDLTQTGLIVRVQGSGTFVSHPKVERGQPFLNSFTEDMRLKGHAPSTRLLNRTVMVPDVDVQERLRLEDGAQTLYLQRLMLADTQPIALHYTHLVLTYCTNVDDWFSSDALRGSIYAILEQRCGHQLSEAEETVEAAVATPPQAKQLDVAVGAPLLWVRRVTYLTSGDPVEDSRMLYRSDRYRLVMRSARAL